MLPIIVTWPAPVAEMLADDSRRTPMEFVVVPHEVPLTVIEPEVAVTQEAFTTIPQAVLVPFAAVPVIVTLPVPVAEMLDVLRSTPLELVPVPHEVPLTVVVPELAVTADVYTSIPEALYVPFAAVPVIVTLPAPVVETLAELYR